MEASKRMTCAHCNDEIDERYDHTCAGCQGRVHRGCRGVCTVGDHTVMVGGPEHVVHTFSYTLPVEDEQQGVAVVGGGGQASEPARDPEGATPLPTTVGHVEGGGSGGGPLGKSALDPFGADSPDEVDDG